MTQQNYYLCHGVPLSVDNNRYYYQDKKPIPAREVPFMSYSMQRVYELYVHPLYTLPDVFHEALKQYIRYFVMAPELSLCQTPQVILDKFQFLEALTPAEMILDLIDYNIYPFEL